MGRNRPKHAKLLYLLGWIFFQLARLWQVTNENMTQIYRPPGVIVSLDRILTFIAGLAVSILDAIKTETTDRVSGLMEIKGKEVSDKSKDHKPCQTDCGRTQQQY